MSAAALKPSTDPASSVEKFEEIHRALNEIDPHFYYDFSIETVVSPSSPPPVPPTPGMVLAVQTMFDQRCVTVKIIARYAEAVLDRPIPGAMTLTADVGTEAESQLENWVKFGVPLRNARATAVSVDAPGGFGVEDQDALVSIGPAVQTPAGEFSLHILDEDKDDLASLDFRTTEVTRGADGQGVRSVLRDREIECLRLEVRIHPGEGTAYFTIGMDSFVGKPVVDALECVRFAAEFQPGRFLRLHARHGAALSGVWPINGALMSETNAEGWTSILRDLSVIQGHLTAALTVPAPADIGRGQPDEWYRAARLLEGEEITGSWTTLPLHLWPGVAFPQGEFAVMLNEPLVVSVADQVLSLGTCINIFESAQLDSSREPISHDDHTDVWLVPGSSNQARQRLATTEEAGAAAAYSQDQGPELGTPEPSGEV